MLIEGRTQNNERGNQSWHDKLEQRHINHEALCEWAHKPYLITFVLRWLGPLRPKPKSNNTIAIIKPKP